MFCMVMFLEYHSSAHLFSRMNGYWCCVFELALLKTTVYQQNLPQVCLVVIDILECFFPFGHRDKTVSSATYFVLTGHTTKNYEYFKQY